MGEQEQPSEPPEPKLKIYVDLKRPLPADADVWLSERELQTEAGALAEAFAKQLGFE